MPFIDATDPTYTGPSTELFDMIRSGGAQLGVRLATHVMSEDHRDESKPFMLIAEMPPNFYIPRHAHATERVEIIVRGTMDVGSGRVIGPGQVMVSHANEFYGPHVVGPEGCVTIEIFGHAAGFLPTTEDGTPIEEAFRSGPAPR